MANSYTKIFKDKEKLEEALLMMGEGKMSLSAIARHFGCDHTTLRYHAKKHGIARPKTWEWDKSPRRPPLSEQEFWKGVNRGKNYKDYLKEAKAKKERFL